MSNDLLLLSLEQNAQALAPLRQNPPLYATIACWEHPGTDPFESLSAALTEYTGPATVVHCKPFCTGVGGHTYALSAFADRAVPADRADAAYHAFTPLAHRMSGLLRELPDRTRERLGFREMYGMPLDDWVWVLFHLAWHFPDHFARGVVRRARLLQTEHGPFVVSEEVLQLSGIAGEPCDRYPGLIFSRFPHELDLVSATDYAIDLFRRAVRGGGALQITDPVRDQLTRWHREFASVGALYADHPSPAGTDPDVRVLRLDDSFHTPPAAEWAGYQAGGAIQQTLLLGHARCVREVCVLRGGSVNDFTTWADRAGSLLPAWPEAPGSALLQDTFVWRMRVNRRRELQSEQYVFVTEDGSPPAGEPIPSAQLAEYYWASMRSPPDGGGLVTDHRGNVERWLGFVFYTLKEYEPESVEIRTVPEGEHGIGHWHNAVLTLKGLNIYQASARAMELAGWVQPAPATTGRPDCGSSSAVRFEDPWTAHGYPPPGTGRYIRFNRGDRTSSGEPRWYPGWAWAERPEDGWVECGECSSGTDRFPLAQGRPPTICDWLPTEWPAAFFPLGGSAEHCKGWRALVRSVFSSQHDTIPPDDERYGWRTLTRATRHLAHHLGVIALERVLTALPDSRDDARREVDPLLDGLVLARRSANGSSEPVRTGVAEVGRPVDSEPAPLASEIEHLLAEARRAYAVSGQGFTLVALPEGRGNGRTRMQRCEDGAADTGQIKDGVFYWPFGRIGSLGTASIDDDGTFALMSLDEEREPTVSYSDFSGRAAAVLLTAAPRWNRGSHPGAGVTTWTAVLMFVAPSARGYTVEHLGGARILRNPWAASIAALRDILTPPSPPPLTLPPPVRERPAWDATARVLRFRGSECKRFAKPAPNQEMVLAAFEEEEWPDAIDDPLTPGKLATTVESLNERLQCIRFGLNGAGTGVYWQAV